MARSFLKNNVLHEASWQNPSIAHSLNKLRDRSYARRSKSQPAVSSPIEAADFDVRYSIKHDHHWDNASAKGENGGYIYSASLYRRNLIGYVILSIGIVALFYVLGSNLFNLIINSWRTILLATGGCLIGAGVILIVRRFEENPLRKIEPPDENAENPLEELQSLAIRTVSRLRTAFHIQISLVIFIATVLVVVLFWSIVMITQEKMLYGTAFGSGGVGMLVLTKWKWQPFDRIAATRKLADDADILATGLRIRMQSIMKIDNPKERAQAQWDAVNDYLASS